jgi:hypothetical protein
MARNTCIKITDFPNHQRCGKTTHLTPTIFYNPNKQISETVYNCQLHTDQIFRPIIGIGSDYGNVQILIDVATGKKKDNTIYGNEMDFQTDKGAESKLSKLYDLRSTIGYKICRLPNCSHKKMFMGKEKIRSQTYTFYGSPLDKQVFTVFPFGQNGRNRHQLYFHEECFDTLKRMLGQMEFPEPRSQLLTMHMP